MYGSPEVTTGGRALKFYASVRVDVRRIEQLKGQNSEFIGSRTRAKVVKNKVAPPFKEAEFDIMYGEGISRIGEIVDLGVKFGVIKKSGAWYYFGEQRLGQGRENVKILFKQQPDFAAEVDGLIREKMKEAVEAKKDGKKPAAPEVVKVPTTKAAAKAVLDIAVDEE